MSDRLCLACDMPLKWHSTLQLKSCESLLQAHHNFTRLIAKGREERRTLELKLEQQPTNKKQNKEE